MSKNTDLLDFLNTKNILYFSPYFEFKIKFYLFRIVFMTRYVLTISIWVNRKFETSEYFFLARLNCRAKKQLVFCDQLSPVSVKRFPGKRILKLTSLQNRGIKLRD